MSHFLLRYFYFYSSLTIGYFFHLWRFQVISNIPEPPVSCLVSFQPDESMTLWQTECLKSLEISMSQELRGYNHFHTLSCGGLEAGWMEPWNYPVGLWLPILGTISNPALSAVISVSDCNWLWHLAIMWCERCWGPGNICADYMDGEVGAWLRYRLHG